MGIRKWAYAAVVSVAAGCSMQGYAERTKVNSQNIAGIQSSIAVIENKTSYLERSVDEYLPPGRKNDERHARNEQAIEELSKRVTIAESDVDFARSISESAEGAVAGMRDAIKKLGEGLRNQGGTLLDIIRLGRASKRWAERSDQISRECFEQSEEAYRKLTEGFDELSIKEQKKRLGEYINRTDEIMERNREAHEENGYSSEEEKTRRKKRIS